MALLSLVTEVLPKETCFRAKRDLVKRGVFVVGDGLAVQVVDRGVTVRLALSLLSCARNKMLIVFASSGI